MVARGYPLVNISFPVISCDTISMIYLVYGNDREQVQAKSRSLIDSLLKKKPDASFFTLNDENISENILDEYSQSQGLFENKYIVLVDGILGVKDKRDLILDRREELKVSPHIFIIREGSLDKATFTKIEKHAEKVQEYSLKEGAVKKKTESNFFAVSDALGSRDKKALWVLYQQAKRDGAEDEQIHGILWWQMKSMMLAAKTKSAAEAGLNPFVYGKATRFAANFSAPELASKASELLALYHDSRRGRGDLATGLEKYILGL